MALAPLFVNHFIFFFEDFESTDIYLSLEYHKVVPKYCVLLSECSVLHLKFILHQPRAISSLFCQLELEF